MFMFLASLLECSGQQVVWGRARSGGEAGRSGGSGAAVPAITLFMFMFMFVFMCVSCCLCAKRLPSRLSPGLGRTKLESMHTHMHT